MIIASAVSYAAIRGITDGTRGGPGARGGRSAGEPDVPGILDAHANIMVISVLERRGGIGLRRALGATRPAAKAARRPPAEALRAP